MAARAAAKRRATVARGTSSPTSSLDLWYPVDAEADQGAAPQASSSASQQPAAPGQAPRRPGHGGRDASLLSVEEQERELALVSSGAGLPRAEARLEQLALWVGAAAAFGAGVWHLGGAEKGQEFFAGYLLEQSLSVDNLFVFVLVFNYLWVPPPPPRAGWRAGGGGRGPRGGRLGARAARAAAVHVQGRRNRQAGCYARARLFSSTRSLPLSSSALEI
jgi:hypothetical protein